MEAREKILAEFIKNGFSKSNGTRTWEITDPNILFSTPELSKGFMDLRRSPAYKKAVIEREMSLIEKNKKEITELIGNKPFNLIDLRCTEGERAEMIVRSLPSDIKIRYCPVGLHSSMTNRAIGRIKKLGMKNVLSYSEQVSDFKNFGEVASLIRNKDFQRNVVMLMGSALGNFEINDFLFNLSKDMFKGDVLIIGNGIRTGERLASLETYKHKLFDDWLVNVMREIGFKESEVQYDARFGNGRVETLYKIKKAKSLKLDGKSIEFKPGDEVQVAVLYKYFEEELKKFCKMYFSKVNLYKDAENEYSLLVCIK